MTGPPPELLPDRATPAGWHLEWAAETRGLEWSTVRPTVTTATRCRYTVGPDRKACGAAAVAWLNRGRRRPRWWAYCERHLYGRRLHDGQPWSAVHRRDRPPAVSR